MPGSPLPTAVPPAVRPVIPPVVAVVGATAAGKTDLSLSLAQRLGGDVVNTDAMQVYRGIDLGTAHQPGHLRRGSTHHLLHLLDRHQAAPGRDFQALARSPLTEPQRPRRGP